MTKHAVDAPQFFLTAPAPCPYLKGREERKVFTHLVGEKAIQINDMLTAGGFRRSQNIAYRPACEHCRACVSARIVVDEFRETKSFKRIIKRNRGLISKQLPAVPNREQFSLFRRYLDSRHETGGMADMTAIDYAMMVEDTHINTRLIEYREPATEITGKLSEPGELVGVALTDILSNGLSMVYTFFDCSQPERSLGNYIILDHVARARKLGLPYVYLGYWVDGSRKMNYKTRFLPQEHLHLSGWERYNPKPTPPLDE